MTTYRNTSASSFSIGSAPPEITWTVVRGDTAAFRVYVTDYTKTALNIPDWTIDMDIVRESTVIVSLSPAPSSEDGDGEFTVALAAEESELLETDDIFDIQMTDGERVWTIAKGTMVIIEDVTD
jgi:hypothetical protein